MLARRQIGVSPLRGVSLRVWQFYKVSAALSQKPHISNLLALHEPCSTPFTYSLALLQRRVLKAARMRVVCKRRRRRRQRMLTQRFFFDVMVRFIAQVTGAALSLVLLRNVTSS